MRRPLAALARATLLWHVVAAATVSHAPPAGAADQAPGAAPAAKAAAPEAPASQAEPKIDKPINSLVRVVEDVAARDRPDKEGKRVGRLRAEGRIKARGVVAGGEWVQIELPNETLAYVPANALAIGANPPAAATPGTPATGATAPTAPAGTAAATAASEVHGAVTAVPDAATLVVDNRRIALAGIDPGPPDVLGPFANWVRSRSGLDCEPQAQTGKYRCFTKEGVDVGEAAILNGAGRVGEGAASGYRDRESEARQAKRGLWSTP